MTDYLFIGYFAFLLLIGECAPLRAGQDRVYHRWVVNIALYALNRGTSRLLALSGVLILIADASNGLLVAIDWPLWIEAPLAFLAMDLFRYAEHRLFHRVPWLWCFHRVHHSDSEFDTTTALRHHPLEVIVSTILQSGFLLLIGPDPLAVIAYFSAARLCALFNHGNVAIASGIDRLVRLVLVTPDMHRIHHSARQPETDSNFGNVFTWWDSWFGTYRAQPRDGQVLMQIGLQEFQSMSAQGLIAQLRAPLRR